ncbi:MAG: tetratricopeptide repeat protein [Chitinophagales bacterium]
MRHLPLFLFAFLCLSFSNLAFTNSAVEILNKYQPQTTIKQQTQEIAFWEQKVAQNPTQSLFDYQLAQAYGRLFKLTADINDLKKAEDLLSHLLDNKGMKDPSSIQRALAHNYISQHRFKEALILVADALKNGSGKRASQLMLFDLYAELGITEAQEQLLFLLAQQEDFNYFIRLAKWKDSQGNLDGAIEAMKQAEQIAEASKQQNQLNWLYTNLGDFYGHAGKIDWSAKYYLKSLAINPADWYAMKGLAWIRYSNDDCPEDALSILEKIGTQSQDPGITLLKAEILTYTANVEKAENIYAQIKTKVSSTAYGDMYNAFLCDYYLQTQNNAKAMQIAKREIEQRAVPVSYSLLAQVLYAQNQIEEAQTVSQEYIWHKSFEPSVLLPQLTFFQNNSSEYICEIAADLREARFELGPIQIQEIPEGKCNDWSALDKKYN